MKLIENPRKKTKIFHFGNTKSSKSSTQLLSEAFKVLAKIK